LSWSDLVTADPRSGYPALTDRVVLVDALTVADAQAHWGGEDDEQARSFGWYPKRSTIEQVRQFLEDTQRQWREHGSRRSFAIRDATTHTLLGGCETRLQGDGTAHLSWWVFPEYRGRGIASRGVCLMILYAVDALSVRTFLVWIEQDNLTSRGVARHAGFVECGMEEEASVGRPMLRYERAV